MTPATKPAGAVPTAMSVRELSALIAGSDPVVARRQGTPAPARISPGSTQAA